MKKVMVLIIAVAMVFTLAGCGKDKKTSKKRTTSTFSLSFFVIADHKFCSSVIDSAITSPLFD